MKTWVRKTLSIGVLAAGALLLAPGAAHADVRPESAAVAEHGWPGQDSGNNSGFLNIPINLCGNALGLFGSADADASCGGGGGHGHRHGHRHFGHGNFDAPFFDDAPFHGGHGQHGSCGGCDNDDDQFLGDNGAQDDSDYGDGGRDATESARS
jgi:hypothetical protein